MKKWRREARKKEEEEGWALRLWKRKKRKVGEGEKVKDNRKNKGEKEEAKEEK